MGFLTWFSESFLRTIRWRELDVLVDQEAISLVETREKEDAYQTARALERARQTEGGWRMARFFAKVAVRVADLTGRRIGPVDTYGGESRYGPARRRVNNGRTERIRP